MNLRELFPSGDQIKLLRGIEADLLKRRRRGMIGAVVGIAAAVLQVVLALTKDGYIVNIGKFFGKILTGDFTGLIGPNGVPANLAIGMAVIVLGIGIYFTLRWTSILAKESKEPFQYTFWIEPFQQVTGTPGNRFSLASSDRLNLLHHDLMERLSRRITRLSLLNINSDVPAEARSRLTSHINVRGDYAVREVHDDHWVIHVMPTIRIGPPGHPETLAEPVKIELSNGKQAPHKQALAADTYNHLIERVYSIVASEIYRQILSDVKNKSTLFPTSYLRAVALYYEAVDFERSNTIDAYDHAISLYRESKRYFDIRLLGGLIRILPRIPALPLWRLSRNALLADAKTRIGLTRSLIYRRIVSGLSGRNQNILFEIPAELSRVIANLTRLQNHETSRKWTVGQRGRGVTGTGEPKSLEEEEPYRSLMGFLTFPFDSALSRGRQDFDLGREMLADAYSVAALAYHRLDAPDKARRLLASAKACNPDVNQKNHLWLLAAAEIETNINKKLLLVKQATELAPEFEIAQYRFAYFSEMRLRMRGEIRKERVQPVIKLYEEVLTINPGNLGALLSQGYLYWLLRDWNTAEKKFNQGYDTKTISRQIFIGEFQYGLARIAVEKGKLDTAYEYFDQAIAADPEVAAYAPIQSRNPIHPKYAYITVDVLKQYQDFRRRAERTIKRQVKAAQTAKQTSTHSDRPLRNLYSFILNDYGNACLNYFHRFGDLKQLTQSIKAYEAAIDENAENFVAFFNLDNAYGWRSNMYVGSKFPGQKTDPLEQAEKLAPAWPAVLIESARKRLATAQYEIKKKREEIATTEIELDREVLRKKSGLTKSQAAPLAATEIAQHEGGTNVSSKSANARVKKSPDTKTLPAASSQTTSRVPELFSRLDQLRNEVEESILNVKNKLSRDITKKIMDGTKWSFLPPEVTTYQGVRVNELIAAKIERDRLDDSDIAALEVWAGILSTNIESREALVAAEKLCQFVLSYYPEKFDSLRSLSTIYEALASMGSPLLRVEDLVDAERIVHKLRNSSEPKIECLRRRFSADRFALLDAFRESGHDGEFRRVLLAGMNELLEDPSLHKEKCFARLSRLPMLRSPKGNSQKVNAIRINRSVLAHVFPFNELKVGKTPRQEVLSTYQRGKRRCESSTSVVMRNWLRADPISFASLKWAAEFTDYLSRDEQLSALKYAEKEARQDQNGAYHYLVGNFSYKQSQDPTLHQDRRNEELEESATCFEKASRLSPEQPLYLNSLGTSRFQLSQYPEAIDSFEKAADLDPNNSEYHANLAAALSANKEWERAFESIRRVKELDNELYVQKLPGIFNARGNDYYTKGQFVESLRDYQEAVRLGPKTAVYHANVALAFAGLKEWERAFAAAEKTKEVDNAMYAQSLAMVYNARGNDYYAKGDYADSLKDYQEAVKLGPKTAVYHANVAVAFAGLNEWERASAAVEKAKELDNAIYVQGLAMVTNARGNDYYVERDYATSLGHYEKAVELVPNAAVYHANVGLALAGLKDWEPSFAAVEKAKDLDHALYAQSLAIVYNARGKESDAKGDYANSLKDYEKAVELDPKKSAYHASVALAFTGLKEWERALAAIRKANELDNVYGPAMAVIYNARGDQYYANRDYPRSIEDYQKAVELHGGSAQYHLNLGRALRELGDLERAISECKKAVELEPTNANNHHELKLIYNEQGIELLNKGEYKQAIEKFQEANQAQDGDDIIYCNLGLAWAALKEPGASEKAVKAVQNAIRINPTNDEYKKILSRIESQNGS